MLRRRARFHGAFVGAVAVTIVYASAIGSSQSRGPALPQTLTVAVTASGVPKDVPELSAAAMQIARRWRADALIVAIDYQHVNAPNVKGPEVRVRAYSPSTKGGYQVTVTSSGARTFEFNGAVRWGTLSLPAVFVDLPVAERTAGRNGMATPVRRASLQVYSPRGAPPVLAWMVHPDRGEGRTVNGATGEIITFDVTGYIARYNQQWEKAARALRALLSRPRSTGNGAAIDFGSGVPGGSSSTYDDGSAERAAYEQRAAESRAYWSGDPDMYNRVKNGECTWSDSSRVGC